MTIVYLDPPFESRKICLRTTTETDTHRTQLEESGNVLRFRYAKCETTRHIRFGRRDVQEQETLFEMLCWKTATVILIDAIEFTFSPSPSTTLVPALVPLKSALANAKRGEDTGPQRLS
jgi:hypothetical protein